MRTLAAAGLATALLTTSSFAADLGGAPRRGSFKDQPIAYAPSYNWTGLYLGVHAGAAFNHDPAARTEGTPGFQSLIAAGITPSSLSLDDTSFTGGGQIGYNWQMGTVVWGVEADLSYLGLDPTGSFTGNPVLGTRLTTSAGYEIGAFGTVRARLGFLATERLMLFATAGLAIADVETTASVRGVDAPGLAWSGTKSETQAGYTIGAGAEYAFTQNMTLKFEYLYYDLGTQKTTAVGNAAVRGTAALNGIDYSNKIDLDGSIVRAGLNFKF